MPATIAATALPAANDPVVLGVRNRVDALLTQGYNAQNGGIGAATRQRILSEMLVDEISPAELVAVHELLRSTRASIDPLEDRYRRARSEADALEGRVLTDPRAAQRYAQAQLNVAALRSALDLAYAKQGPLSELYSLMEELKPSRPN